MKAVFTLILVFAFGSPSIAQVELEKPVEKKTEQKQIEVVNTKEDSEQKKLARVYLYKNSRIKKELKFKTKNNKSKLA